MQRNIFRVEYPINACPATDGFFIFWLLFIIPRLYLRRNISRAVELFIVLYSLFFILYFYSILTMIINCYLVNKVYRVSKVTKVHYGGNTSGLSIRLMPVRPLADFLFFDHYFLFPLPRAPSLIFPKGKDVSFTFFHSFCKINYLVIPTTRFLRIMLSKIPTHWILN